MSRGGEADPLDDSGLTKTPDVHWSQAAQRHYDPADTGELTTAIVFAIAEAMGVEPQEVKSPSLYECVDAAALEDTFFGPSVTGESRQGIGTVEFRYTEYLVTVRSDGWVQVYEPAETDTSG